MLSDLGLGNDPSWPRQRMCTNRQDTSPSIYLPKILQIKWMCIKVIKHKWWGHHLQEGRCSCSGPSSGYSRRCWCSVRLRGTAETKSMLYGAQKTLLRSSSIRKPKHAYKSIQGKEHMCWLKQMQHKWPPAKQALTLLQTFFGS